MTQQHGVLLRPWPFCPRPASAAAFRATQNDFAKTYQSCLKRRLIYLVKDALTSRHIELKRDSLLPQSLPGFAEDLSGKQVMVHSRGRPVAALALRSQDRTYLERQVRRYRAPRSLSERCRIILRCADGMSSKGVGAELGFHEHTVGKWRRRFLKGGALARNGSPVRNRREIRRTFRRNTPARDARSAAGGASSPTPPCPNGACPTWRASNPGTTQGAG